MRIVRGLGAALTWIAASLLGLVGVVLCITVILLPLGIPLLKVSRRLFGVATKLMLPRAVSHPVQEAGKSLKKRGRRARKKLPG
ncbi:MAG TPA: hypothetical protein VFG63_14450 [Nocardioidaceae bacterium]|nr:hypothetical protein [Nocardioidaceae bacterium]